MSKAIRTPYNDDAGYVCSRQMFDGGHIVVYDRRCGGDWIDGDTRWVVSRYNAERINEGLLDMPTKADAIGMMKSTLAGETDWYVQARPHGIRSDDPIAA